MADFELEYWSIKYAFYRECLCYLTPHRLTVRPPVFVIGVFKDGIQILVSTGNNILQSSASQGGRHF